jgi:hypothetical protein
MMKLVVAVLVVMLLAAPVAVRGHEGHMHKALGTIAAIQGDLVEVKTTEGKTIKVTLAKKTVITRGTEKLDAGALKVGERVSVDYMEEKKVMVAHGVKLGAASK